MRDDREKLRDILEAIERIERYAAQEKQAFEQNELIQTWSTQNLQVIGEASRALSSAIRDQYPEVPWTKIIGMRNILTHNYFQGQPIVSDGKRRWVDTHWQRGNGVILI
jgi:uncharacterized protein with HEPN domain